jgi:hypothetical protein
VITTFPILPVSNVLPKPVDLTNMVSSLKKS